MGSPTDDRGRHDDSGVRDRPSGRPGVPDERRAHHWQPGAGRDPQRRHLHVRASHRARRCAHRRPGARRHAGRSAADRRPPLRQRSGPAGPTPTTCTATRTTSRTSYRPRTRRASGARPMPRCGPRRGRPAVQRDDARRRPGQPRPDHRARRGVGRRRRTTQASAASSRSTSGTRATPRCRPSSTTASPSVRRPTS